MNKETDKSQRELVYPAIYKHFKHSSNNAIPNNYMYVVIGVSKPLLLKDFPDDIYKRDKYSPMSIHHTEFDDEDAIYYINSQWCHSQEWCSKELVLYKSLYDNHITYARPIDIFLSKVDKEKYPNINQEYRFELVRY